LSRKEQTKVTAELTTLITKADSSEIFRKGFEAQQEVTLKLGAERDSFKAKAEALDWLEANCDILKLDWDKVEDFTGGLTVVNRHGDYFKAGSLLSAITAARAPIESPGADPKPESEADPTSDPEA